MSWSAPAPSKRPSSLSALRGARGGLDGLRAEPRRVIGLDVEYVHFKADGLPLKVVAAEVCLVEAGGAVLYQSYCHPGSSIVASSTYVGGVPSQHWAQAPALKLVAADLRVAIAGCLLVGHGLSKDLIALGISHPKELRRDTMHFSKFQGSSGQSRKLEALTKQLLGRNIQQGRHRAQEDATAVLELYLQFIAGDPHLMAEAELRQHYLDGILAGMQSRAQAGNR